MVIIIILIIVAVIFIAISIHSSSQQENARAEAKERKKQDILSIEPDARIIANDGNNVFFVIDKKDRFGTDTSGRTYTFSGIKSIQKYSDCIRIYHEDRIDGLCVGKDVLNSFTSPLDHSSIISIYSELMPILRKNFHKDLSEYNIKPTHEYEVNGELWGCDLNSKKFFTSSAFTQIFDFNDLMNVNVDNIENNTLIEGKRIINVSVWTDYSDEPVDFDLYFDNLDSTYNNLLAMFKGIRNRQSG